MPLERAPGLIAVGAVQFALGLAAGCFLLRLHALRRDRYLLYWAVAWLIQSLYSLLGLAVLVAGAGLVDAFSLLTLLLIYVQPGALVLAALTLAGRRPGPAAHAGLAAAALGVGTAFVLVAAGLPEPERPAAVSAPPFLLFALANLWFAAAFARHAPRASTGAGRVVVASSLAYALHLAVVAATGGPLGSPYGRPEFSALVGLLLPMGITSGIVLTVLDDVAASERRLRGSESTNRALLEAIPDALFVLDRDGVFRSYRPGRDLDAAIEPEAFLGRSLEEVFPAEVAAFHRARLEEAFATGRTRVYEYSLPAAGSATFESRLAASDDGLAIGIVRDVTERRRAAAERERLIAQLEDRNAELERFTYTVSHDLKAPLTTIANFAGALERDVESGRTERVADDLRRIQDASARMKELLDDLLALARGGRALGDTAPVPMREVVDAAHHLVAGGDASRLAVHCARDLPTVQGDRTRLVEVMANLLSNAERFAGDSRPARVEIAGRAEDGRAVFTVRDRGIGIDPRHHETIFGLFEKLDSEGDGTGIGLALVRRIVEAHGGWIRAESEGAGAGATFRFALPAATSPGAGGTAAQSSGEETSR